jgi:hypothetical protein
VKQNRAEYVASGCHPPKMNLREVKQANLRASNLEYFYPGHDKGKITKYTVARNDLNNYLRRHSDKLQLMKTNERLRCVGDIATVAIKEFTGEKNSNNMYYITERYMIINKIAEKHPVSHAVSTSNDALVRYVPNELGSTNPSIH